MEKTESRPIQLYRGSFKRLLDVPVNAEVADGMRYRLNACSGAEAVTYGDLKIRSEALALAKESLPLDNEALERAESTPRDRRRSRTSGRRKGRR